MILGEWQFCQFEELRPADTFDPVIETFPVARVILVGLQNFLDDGGRLGPAWRIVGDACSNQFLEARFAARIGSGVRR